MATLAATRPLASFSPTPSTGTAVANAKADAKAMEMARLCNLFERLAAAGKNREPRSANPTRLTRQERVAPPAAAAQPLPPVTCFDAAKEDEKEVMPLKASVTGESLIVSSSKVGREELSEELKSFSAIVASRSLGSGPPSVSSGVMEEGSSVAASARITGPTNRRRRNTLASSNRNEGGVADRGCKRESSIDEGAEGDDSKTESLPEDYSFTFRLMVHKLYETDEWAKTVRDMLAKSKVAFKPLTDKDAPADEKAETVGGETEKDLLEKDDVVHFKVPSIVPGSAGGMGKENMLRSPGPSMGGRRRSHSSASNSGPANHRPIIPPSPLSPSGNGNSSAQMPVRALKKRCVGRRKSNTKLSAEADNESSPGMPSPLVRSNWVYAAAISSAECPAPAAYAAFPPAPPSSPSASLTPRYGGPMMLGASRNTSGVPSSGLRSKKRVSVDLRGEMLMEMEPMLMMGPRPLGSTVSANGGQLGDQNGGLMRPIAIARKGRILGTSVTAENLDKVGL